MAKDLVAKIIRGLPPGTIRINNCFDNCMIIFIAADGRLEYAEGFLHSPSNINTHHHAWLRTNDGKIIDPTLELSGYKGAVGYEEISRTKKL